MDKVTIGIPRGFFDNYQNLWKYYLENLGFNIVLSKLTDREIIELGNYYSNDEMCTSLKVFLGHIAYLQDKCDYLLIPRIENYGINNQMCTNFTSIYDIAHNIFEKSILNFDVNISKKLDEKKGLIELGLSLGKTKKECCNAFDIAVIKNNKNLKKIYIGECNKLKSNKKKVLLMGHSYNIHDNLIGKPISNFIKNNDFEIIYSDYLPKEKTLKLSHNICRYLYYKHNKESVGALELCKNKIDGVILLSSFPCGPDSLVNELVIRKVKIPILNLVIDDVNSFTGIETRLESFIDVMNSKDLKW